MRLASFGENAFPFKFAVLRLFLATIGFRGGVMRVVQDATASGWCCVCSGGAKPAPRKRSHGANNRRTTQNQPPGKRSHGANNRRTTQNQPPEEFENVSALLGQAFASSRRDGLPLQPGSPASVGAAWVSIPCSSKRIPFCLGLRAIHGGRVPGRFSTASLGMPPFLVSLHREFLVSICDDATEPCFARSFCTALAVSR